MNLNDGIKWAQDIISNFQDKEEPEANDKQN